MLLRAIAGGIIFMSLLSNTGPLALIDREVFLNT
ncbi:hypothetical protein cbdbA991 [Dehalococcoides mccartyi CBDB1]|uniref:Uncharacterized protein n=1 Tax=Dehalococcoides mccartyi (strain CBDB1) TaxID=255470 RepID=A0A916KMK6_DEHMC|nr:hypothetical protein cbdbA991 [Dehalococcoides mccartyi CBDB1]